MNFGSNIEGLDNMLAIINEGNNAINIEGGERETVFSNNQTANKNIEILKNRNKYIEKIKLSIKKLNNLQEKLKKEVSETVDNINNSKSIEGKMIFFADSEKKTILNNLIPEVVILDPSTSKFYKNARKWTRIPKNNNITNLKELSYFLVDLALKSSEKPKEYNKYISMDICGNLLSSLSYANLKNSTSFEKLFFMHDKYVPKYIELSEKSTNEIYPDKKNSIIYDFNLCYNKPLPDALQFSNFLTIGINGCIYYGFNISFDQWFKSIEEYEMSFENKKWDSPLDYLINKIFEGQRNFDCYFNKSFPYAQCSTKKDNNTVLGILLKNKNLNNENNFYILLHDTKKYSHDEIKSIYANGGKYPYKLTDCIIENPPPHKIFSEPLENENMMLDTDKCYEMAKKNKKEYFAYSEENNKCFVQSKNTRYVWNENEKNKGQIEGICNNNNPDFSIFQDVLKDIKEMWKIESKKTGYLPSKEDIEMINEFWKVPKGRCPCNKDEISNNKKLIYKINEGAKKVEAKITIQGFHDPECTSNENNYSYSPGTIIYHERDPNSNIWNCIKLWEPSISLQFNNKSILKKILIPFDSNDDQITSLTNNQPNLEYIGDLKNGGPKYLYSKCRYFKLVLDSSSKADSDAFMSTDIHCQKSFSKNFCNRIYSNNTGLKININTNLKDPIYKFNSFTDDLSPELIQLFNILHIGSISNVSSESPELISYLQPKIVFSLPSINNELLGKIGYINKKKEGDNYKISLYDNESNFIKDEKSNRHPALFVNTSGSLEAISLLDNNKEYHHDLRKYSGNNINKHNCENYCLNSVDASYTCIAWDFLPDTTITPNEKRVNKFKSQLNNTLEQVDFEENEKEYIEKDLDKIFIANKKNNICYNLLSNNNDSNNTPNNNIKKVLNFMQYDIDSQHKFKIRVPQVKDITSCPTPINNHNLLTVGTIPIVDNNNNLSFTSLELPKANSIDISFNIEDSFPNSCIIKETIYPIIESIKKEEKLLNSYLIQLEKFKNNILDTNEENIYQKLSKEIYELNNNISEHNKIIKLLDKENGNLPNERTYLLNKSIEDSMLTLINTNNDYILWTILAILVIIATIHFSRKK